VAVSMRESSRSWQSQLTALLLGTLIVVALFQPGVVLGAALTAGWWRARRPSARALLIVGLVSCAAAALAVGAVTWGWSWRWWFTVNGTSPFFPASWTLPQPMWPLIGRSVAAEVLAGPAWGVGILFIRWTQEGMPSGMIQQQKRKQDERLRRLGITPAGAPDQPPTSEKFRLGTEAENRVSVDLSYPGDVAQHISVLGKMGSGKTTTAARLIEGALTAGWAVVIIDAKGFGSLRLVAQRFAERFGVPFRLVAPDDPESLKYNPCSGTPSQISNKLIGAFNFGADAEIYKNIALEVIPVLIRALRAADRPVTLANLFRSLSAEGMVGLTRSIPESHDVLRDHVRDMSDRRAPYPAAYAGMRGRFGALLEGMYGQLFTVDADDDAERFLDMSSAFTDGGGVTYISLPAMEAAEDVELMARVLAQDIKQVAAARIARGETGYALLVLDEFAGLREATQLNDLLLQAREARICCAVCSQFLPNLMEAPALRHALLSAGMFISHQCSSEDAEAIAGLFGTQKAVELTNQVDYATGASEKGSMRQVDEYRVHPNELRDLARGTAAIRIEPGTRRIAIVRVDRPTDMERGHDNR
jgi:hypothetical protein